VTPALARFAADLDTAHANSRALTAQWTELVAAYRAARGPARKQPDTEENRPMTVEIRYDIVWTVVIRIQGTGNWIDWCTGHRTVQEALAEAETIVGHPAIAEIRFDRTTKTRERFSLADLSPEDPS
jgi:hypothetical protein